MEKEIIKNLREIVDIKGQIIDEQRKQIKLLTEIVEGFQKATGLGVK